MLRQQHSNDMTDECVSLRDSPIFCGTKFMVPIGRGLGGGGGGGGGGTWNSNLMSNALPFEVWTIKTRCFLPSVFNADCGEKDIQGIHLWCWYSKWYLCTGSGILFLTDDEGMFLRNGHFFGKKCLTAGVSTQNLSRGPAVPLFSCISCIFLYSDLPPVFSCITIKNAANSCFFLYFWKWLEQVPMSFFRTNVNLL